MIGSRVVCILALAVSFTAAAVAEEACPSADKPIATDRPDVTNSSIVVPVGSFQNENGVNVTSMRGVRILDATNSRLRLGIAPCLEILVDLPTYVARLRGPAPSGFTNVAPAIKWQISPNPGTFDLSITAGAALPSGDTGVNGPGTQPYIQLPWSRELGDGWGTSGMFTVFFHPADLESKVLTETTFSLEKELREDLSVFVEYVGDFPERGRSQQLLNTGASWHVTRLQQIDGRIAFGLNNNSPDLVVGLGYSFRVDGLFH